MLSVTVNLVSLLATIVTCHSVMGAGIWALISSNSNQQQTNLGLDTTQKSSLVTPTAAASAGRNWLNTQELESVQYIAPEDSNDYKVIASALINKLSSIKTIEQLNEFIIRLRNFSDRNNYLTSSFLRDNRPVYMEEYQTRVDPRQYSGLELVASILNSSDAKSLLSASRNGDYKIMSDLFSEYKRSGKQQQNNNKSQTIEQSLLAKAEQYPLLSSVFQRLLKSPEKN